MNRYSYDFATLFNHMMASMYPINFPSILFSQFNKVLS
jgi:hypothetical protein